MRIPSSELDSHGLDLICPACRGELRQAGSDAMRCQNCARAFPVLLGIPAYLNGLAAIPLVGGLIDMGMNPAVGLAFMVAGGVTSIPAAMAVWALVRPRVFALYFMQPGCFGLRVGITGILLTNRIKLRAGSNL